ncbi:MAG: extracellular matrix/biofilm biosynthesis regulator RemA family protein, partial [Acetomicrobium sp.]
MRKLVHVGFGNVVVANRIIAIIHPDSSPVKRLRDEARERG